ALGEIAYDLEVDIGVDQCAADLVHRLADVLLADPPAPRERAEHAAEFVGECVEHMGNNRRFGDIEPSCAQGAANSKCASQSIWVIVVDMSALLRGAGADLIPRHPAQEHPHAAPIGDA